MISMQQYSCLVFTGLVGPFPVSATFTIIICAQSVKIDIWLLNGNSKLSSSANINWTFVSFLRPCEAEK